VGVASSGAFACTSYARLATSDGAGYIAAKPSQVVTVTSTSFRTPQVGGYGPISFEWTDNEGKALLNLTSITSATPALADGALGGAFVSETGITTMRFAVPDTATTQPTGKSYHVRASQMAPLRDTPFAATVRVFIENGFSGKAGQNVAGGGEDTSGITASGGGQSLGNIVTNGVVGDGAPAAAGVVAAPERKLAPPVAEAGPGSPQVAEVPVAPGVPAVSAVGNDDPTQPATAAPAEAKLWSGLRSSASPSTLLDGPQGASSSSGSPAGVILLGMGFLALAGTGATLGQRRLAVAKAARR
jgi:hypothetical protein